MILAILIIGCKNPDIAEQDTIGNLDSTLTEFVDTSFTIEDEFSFENIKRLGDTLANYFKKAGYNMDNYLIIVDTTDENNYTKLTFKLKNNLYKTDGVISYDIYTFKNKDEATDFFNDLKTQELVKEFGISKTPQHILLDSNRVIWHHLRHGYGHRVKDLTGIFNTTFDFHPNSSNLDSISGFTYCKCINNDTNLTEIKGKWTSSSYILAYSISSYDKNNCSKHFIENIELKVTSDSIYLNNKGYDIKVNSSINLPDSRFFWKYLIYGRTSFGFHNYIVDYNEDFMDKIKTLQLQKEKLIVYEVSLIKGCYITFVKLASGKAYLIANEKFYTLKSV